MSGIGTRLRKRYENAIITANIIVREGEQSVDYQKDRNVDVFSGRKFSSKFEKFEFWMTNYFWYHFKWYVIIPLFIVVVLLSWLISSLVKVNYNWEVIYAHTGEPNPVVAESVREYVQDLVISVTGDKKAKVRVTEITSAVNTEHPIMGALENYEYTLYIVDMDTADYYGRLGYFEEIDGQRFAKVSSLELLVAVNDAEYREHSIDENSYAGYTEAEMADLNVVLAEKHNEQVSQTVEIFKKVN